MKHPALTRVLSAALAIMCVIMLAAGAVGLGKAESQYDDDTADYEKLTGRVTLYKELDEKLKNGTTYKEDSERLDAAQKQHDKDAAEYRMELAERTATKGGLKMGEDALAQAQAMIGPASQMFQTAQAQFQAEEAKYSQILSAADQLIAGAYEVVARLAPPVEPVKPEEPAKPEEPQYIDTTGLEGEELEKAQALNQELQAGYEQQLAAYEAEYQAYQDALAAYESEYAAYLAEKEAYDAAAGEALNAGNELLRAAGLPIVSSPEQALALLNELIGMAQERINDARATLDDARRQLAEAGEQLAAAQQMIQSSYAQMWAKQSELDGQNESLASRRDSLLGEALRLAAEKNAADEKKENERRFSSTRALLKGYDGVKAKLDAGGVLPDSAEEYAAEYNEEYNRLHTVRRVMCLLEVIGGVLGFLCIPAAYEKSKSRFLLIAPACASFACAAAAETAGAVNGLGQSYAAIPVMIFAALYLLAAAPRIKSHAQA